MPGQDFGNADRAAALDAQAPKPSAVPEAPAGDPLKDIVQILEAVAPQMPPEKGDLVKQAASLLQQAASAQPQGGPGNASAPAGAGGELPPL